MNCDACKVAHKYGFVENSYEWTFLHDATRVSDVMLEKIAKLLKRDQVVGREWGIQFAPDEYLILSSEELARKHERGPQSKLVTRVVGPWEERR